MTVDSVRQSIYFPSMDEKPRLLVGAAAIHGPAPHDDFREHAPRRRGARVAAQARTASTPRRSRATCRRRSACACCAISTAATSPVLIGTDVASRGPAHPRREPRLQLRPAPGSGGLRAPDRPHRARWRRRRCDQLSVARTMRSRSRTSRITSAARSARRAYRRPDGRDQRARARAPAPRVRRASRTRRRTGSRRAARFEPWRTARPRQTAAA